MTGILYRQCSFCYDGHFSNWQ